MSQISRIKNWRKRDFESSVFVLFMFLFFFPSRVSCAQIGRLFDTDNHLSSNFVNQVMQDSKGYIWIATNNGLNIYDGYNFAYIFKDTPDRGGLLSNHINCLGMDKDKNVLVGTNKSFQWYGHGLMHDISMIDYNGKKLNTYVKCIETLRDGTVLVGTSGYGILCMKSNAYARRMGGVLRGISHVQMLREDFQKRLWIITEEGEVFCKEPSGKLTSHFSGLVGAYAIDMRQDSRGNIYIATRNKGVLVMKQGHHTFEQIPALGNVCDINTINIDKQGRLYIGVDGQGVLLYSPSLDKVDGHPFYCNTISLSKTKVSCIIEDKQGNIWLGLHQKGVFMQSTQRTDFNYVGYHFADRNVIGENCVNSVLVSKSQHLWVGVDKDGVYQLDSYGRLIKHYTSLPSTVMALEEDGDGNIWVGSFLEGCGYMDPQGRYHVVELQKGKSLSVFGIKYDLQGCLWFATMGDGLYCRKADGTVKHYLANPAKATSKTNLLANNYLNQMALSVDGRYLYIASCVGLLCLDTENDNWVNRLGVNCFMVGTYVVCVYVDHKNQVWYGTEEGLYCYQPGRNSHPKVYTKKDGLPSDAITGISEDCNHNMWIGTNHGLCRFNPSSGKMDVFYGESGLQGNEFSERAFCYSPRCNLLLVGGTSGINWFNPQKVQLQSRRWVAEVRLSDIIVGGKHLYPGMKSGGYTITDLDIYDSHRFEFSNKDNSLSLFLSTRTYDDVERISYAYRVNDENWHLMKRGNNELVLNQLAAGTYRLHIKAIYGAFSSAENEITIVIHPVWYATIWAKMFYLILLLLLVYLYIRHLKRKENDRIVLQQHIHAEEMGEAKLRFFMNISHEIRTPLTLILTPLLSLIKEDKDSKRQGVYSIMRKNSERILNLVNQMLDLRKIDKGQMVMHMSETDLVAFTENACQLFQQQAFVKDICFSFTHDSQTLEVWIDRTNFDKVLMNVLSNAFKFTPHGGKIQVALTHTAQNAIISVKDSGSGIPEDKLETIFQRFYQNASDPNDRNVGTGIGLDLTRSLVELHYGTIDARNNVGEPGCEFIIRLPLGNSHLSEEEIVLPTPRTARKKTLFIVDDEEDIASYLQSQLSDEYRVLCYVNGKEAWSEIVRLQPSLVISDVMMPEMDGNTLCAKMKANTQTNHIPVIMLTAKSRDEDKMEGLANGADAYIMKPFNMDILRQTISNLLCMRQTLFNKFSGNESQGHLLETVEVKSPDKQLMERIMQAINQHLDEPQLRVDTIANEIGLSRMQLTRKMKEITNQTPHAFIRNVKLQQAARLFKEDSNQSVSQVMYACGFNNPTSFSTMFKDTFGVSPRDYMKQSEKRD